MPIQPRRHFLAWDEPLLPQAVRHLAAGWQGPEPLDLSDCAVVVPTQQSGRRLREALAAHTATRGAAVFPPRVFTPESFLAHHRPAVPRLDALLGWIAVLRSIELSDFREVFPVDPPERDFPWCLRIAEQLGRLSQTLAENQLTLGDVPTLLPPTFPEFDRWRQLAALGALHQEELAAAGVTPGAAIPVEGITRILLVATPDPQPALVRVLQQQPNPVEVIVFAPESEAAAFDAWGRPVADVWARRDLALEQFVERVHLCADPNDQAERVAGLARQYASVHATGTWAVALADPELRGLVRGEAGRAGIEVFNPDGDLRRRGTLYHLLEALGDGAETRSFTATQALARCPDFLRYLHTRLGPSFSAAAFLAGLDRLQRDHLPADLSSARRHARADCAPALDVIADLDRRLREEPFPRNVAALLAELFAGRLLDGARPRDADLLDAAQAWTSTVRECAAGAARFEGVAADEVWTLALQLFGDSRRTDDKPVGALELQGWLELLFEDAPHLVVAGMNDGMVPEAISDDPFLPDSLRVRLGLRNNATRFARDAYLLQAISASRARGGRLDLLLGKTSTAGDPLRPSRLLLRCADIVLPERVAFLFRTPPQRAAHLAWHRAWTLRPGPIVPPATVAVTSLRRWLACPFRFYLQSVLRMEAVDPAKTEMDAFDFGTLCHASFEAMGRDPHLRQSVDPGTLRDFLVAELERNTRAKFGDDLTLPLLIQLESARQRLTRLAHVQAAERAEGWVIQEVERPFAIELGGLVVKGKIDRIDRHERTGAVRVLDYKTSDSPTSPADAHLRPARAVEDLPAWRILTTGSRTRAWADLQLPLYLHALAADYGTRLDCGYVVLPKAVTETAVSLWQDYTPELHDAALQCAESVCRAIVAGEFWPPNETIRADADDFGALFHHGAAKSVDWSGDARTGVSAQPEAKA